MTCSWRVGTQVFYVSPGRWGIIGNNLEISCLLDALKINSGHQREMLWRHTSNPFQNLSPFVKHVKYAWHSVGCVGRVWCCHYRSLNTWNENQLHDLHKSMLWRDSCGERGGVGTALLEYSPCSSSRKDNAHSCITTMNPRSQPREVSILMAPGPKGTLMFTKSWKTVSQWAAVQTWAQLTPASHPSLKHPCSLPRFTR